MVECRVLYCTLMVQYRRFVGRLMVKSVGQWTILGLSCRGACRSADRGWKSSGIPSDRLVKYIVALTRTGLTSPSRLRAKGSYRGWSRAFPNLRGKPLSDITLSRLIKELGIAAVPHWVPVELPGLGRGTDEHTPRGGRGRARPYGA